MNCKQWIIHRMERKGAKVKGLCLNSLTPSPSAIYDHLSVTELNEIAFIE